MQWSSAARSCTAGVALGAMEPISGGVIALVGLEQRNFWASGGPNDLKVGLSRSVPYVTDQNRTRWVQDMDGSRIRQDVFGNVQFGAIYASAGIPKATAVNAANSGGVAGISDPADDVAIGLGYTLFETFPDGASHEQIHEFFSSRSTRVTLQGVGLYAPVG